MDIVLGATATFSECGRRDNNEDSIYPRQGAEGAVTSGLYMVCDGVGGRPGGEIASAIACSNIAGYIGRQAGLAEQELDSIISRVQTDMTGYVAAHPGYERMCTTLALLYFTGTGAVIAHIGDSRAYHIRGGDILFVTRDHSKANHLLDLGKLTQEEADAYPEKNIIMRVLTADNVSKAFADYRLVTDIRSGDVFFLCSDGVLEGFTSTEIAALLSDVTLTVAERARLICERCAEMAYDNFSGCVIEIADVDNTDAHEKEPINRTTTGIISAWLQKLKANLLK